MKHISTRFQRIAKEKVELSRNFRAEPTEAEARLWQLLRGKKLGGYKFRRQQIIAGFIVDFFNAKTGHIIEVDGEIHMENKAYDKERDDVLKSAGFSILRVKNETLLSDSDSVLKDIRSLLEKLDS